MLKARELIYILLSFAAVFPYKLYTFPNKGFLFYICFIHNENSVYAFV